MTRTRRSVPAPLVVVLAAVTALAVVVAVAAYRARFRDARDCQARGGSYVNTWDGWECVGAAPHL